MSFIVVQIVCEGKTLTTSVYCKPTFSGVYTHFDSFLTVSFAMFTYALTDASKYVQVGLNYKLN